MACFENFSSNFFSNFNISYTIPMENVENVITVECQKMSKFVERSWKMTKEVRK